MLHFLKYLRLPNPELSMAKKICLIISDLHLGAGVFFENGDPNRREDFVHDRALADFLAFHCRGKYRSRQIDLIINGDFFELLETLDYSENPLRMTETAVIARLEQIVAGHPIAFTALKKFALGKNHSIRFITGNHDQGLLFAGARDFLRAAIHRKVEFSETAFTFADVYVEHGNQYVHVTRYNPNRRIVTDQTTGTPIINHDWGSIFALEVLYRFKGESKNHLTLYNMNPFGKMILSVLGEDFGFGIRHLYSTLRFFLRSILAKAPFGLTNWRFDRKLLNSFSLDYSAALESAARRILNETKYRKVIFGHSHKNRFRKYPDGGVYINTGTWIREINLSLASPGTWTRFPFARIEHNGISSNVELREWKGLPVPDPTMYAE